LQVVRCNNTAYFLMPFLEGETIEQRHRTRLRTRQESDGTPLEAPGMLWSLAEIVSILEPLVQALEHLHQQVPPVLHRDVKPANLYLACSNDARPDRLILLDFGAAREMVEHRTMSRIYTPGFASPEQVSGAPQTTATDIFGAAATVHFLLTNQVAGIVSGDVDSAQGSSPLIPASLSAVLGAALSPAQHARPTLRELLGVLQSAAAAMQSGGESSSRMHDRPSDHDPRSDTECVPENRSPKRETRRRWRIGITVAMTVISVLGIVASVSVLADNEPTIDAQVEQFSLAGQTVSVPIPNHWFGDTTSDPFPMVIVDGPVRQRNGRPDPSGSLVRLFELAPVTTKQADEVAVMARVVREKDKDRLLPPELAGRFSEMRIETLANGRQAHVYDVRYPDDELSEVNEKKNYVFDCSGKLFMVEMLIKYKSDRKLLSQLAKGIRCR
jgi:serine/threonine protein kinase